MPTNLPNFDVQRLSIGPAVIYFGAAGTTPTTDLGAVRGADLKIAIETTKFLVGMPAVPSWYRFKAAEITLTVKGLEWNLNKIRRAIGGYYLETTQGNLYTETLYGNFEFVDPLSLRLVHATPYGSTIIVDIFQALPGGADQYSFGYNVHEIPYVWHAVSTTYDWAGNALPPNTPYKITFQQTVS
jgi:hypothetical protein